MTETDQLGLPAQPGSAHPIKVCQPKQRVQSLWPEVRLLA